MNSSAGKGALKWITALFALNGVPGLLGILLVLSLFLIERFTGMELLKGISSKHVTLGGWVIVLGMGIFWALEVAAALLVWRRLSKLAIYLAVGLTGCWVVLLVGILQGMRGTSTPAFPMASTAVIVFLPCILTARWLCAHLLKSMDATQVAELGAPPNSGPAEHADNSGAVGGPPSVS